MVYGIFTAGQRTWGGPRVDAGAADAHTTPQQVIENAEAMGDELNVVPESFKPAAEAQTNQLTRVKLPLQPPERVEGRFAAAARLPGGWYQQPSDSMASLGASQMLSGDPKHNPLNSRESYDSGGSGMTSANSIIMPRRVESIMGEEDRKKYAMAQASQREAGGAYMTSPPHGHVYEMSEIEMKKEGFKESVESLVSVHRRIGSDNSIVSAGDTATHLEPTAGVDSLTVPHAFANGGRNGRSPLARASLIRTVSSSNGNDLALGDEDQNQQIQEAPRGSNY